MAKPTLPSIDVAPSLLALFGPPPLLAGEEAAAYDELLARVSAAVQPADILEEIWVRDVVDLVWETFRLRRLKASLLVANAHAGLKIILNTFLGWGEGVNLPKRWAARDRSAIKEVAKLLASAGLTMDAVMAETLSLQIDRIERIDRMIMGAEARRDAALRELDRHRASLAQALRRVSDDVEDAQFEEVVATQIANQSAA